MQDNTNIILRQYEDEHKLEQLHKEREEVQSLEEFQKWLSDMKIGSRVEVKDKRAEELNAQYDFRKLNPDGSGFWPTWVRDLYR